MRFGRGEADHILTDACRTLAYEREAPTMCFQVEATADSRSEVQGNQQHKVQKVADTIQIVTAAYSKLSSATCSGGMMLERQEHSQQAGKPYLSEALWCRISEHMTIHEWCKAAGTCKTSYNVPLKWARLSRHLPLEGLQVALETY